jgi:C4-dicarboxylate-specific signal transduction histidine kinase
MASGIAHEINNPLTIISSYARSLKRTNSEKENDPKINEAADKIVITVNRIAKIIKGLRSFARDSFNDAIVPTSIQKVIESTLELCHEKLKDNSIELKINTFIDFEVECREVQITQVLVNLLNNSRDAVDGPDKWIKIEVIDSGIEAVLTISDSGKKISKEVADKIMQPFFTTKEIGKGLGLGLSISKGIVEGHNGKFYLDMDAAHTTFVIKLPKSNIGHVSFKAS